jgi:hypothetical protein
MAKRVEAPAVIPSEEPTVDLAGWMQMRDHGKDVKTLFSARNTMLEEMDKMFLLPDSVTVTKSRRRSQDQDTKRTLSPDPRDNLLGAWRLMIATDPQFEIPHNLNDAVAVEQSSKMEQAAQVMWFASGRAQDTPVHFDALLSGMLYDEMHLAVTPTDEIVKNVAGGSRAAIARAELLARRTPYLFEVWNPKNGFYERDNLGLTFYYQEQAMKAGQVMDRYGEVARRVLGGRSRYADVTLCRAWDLQSHGTWIAEASIPFAFGDHALPFIPVVQQKFNGSRLFTKHEENTQPFLYGILKSGMWDRANLALTVYFTLLFALGTNPLFVYTAEKEGKKLNVTYDNIGGMATIKTGETLTTMFRQVVDPEMLRGMEITEAKMTQSTIYRQALGEALTGDAPFAALSLLHQAGRLPLINAKRQGGWGMGKAVELALRWMKADKKKASAKYRDLVVELDASQIPDDFEVDCVLEIDLPQDKLQASVIADRITSGDDPLASREWARRNVLQIGQSDKMQEQIWSEKAAGLRAMQYFGEQLAQIKLSMDQAMTPTTLPPTAVAPPGGGGGEVAPVPPGAGGPIVPQSGPPVPGPEGNMVPPTGPGGA